MWNDSTRQNDPNLSAQAQSCAYIPEMVSNIYIYIQFVLKNREINLAAFQYQYEKRAKFTHKAGYMLLYEESKNSTISS